MKEGISALMNIHNTEDPMGEKGILHLKFKRISSKQKKEILNQGPMDIKLKFSCDGVYTNVSGKKYLTFGVLALRRCEEQRFVPPDDDF